MSDRELSTTLLDRTLEAVRSRRQDLLGPRWTSPSKRWEGKPGIVFEKDIVREYLNGSSQSLIAEKFHIEWSKLRQVLLSHGLPIRRKSQQMFMDLHGRSPKIRFGLSRSKLYIIFAMFGDGLRPTSQTKQRTHIIGIAAGKDRDFAENWISEFEQEYSARPALRRVGVNNIQASISSLDIWNDLHSPRLFRNPILGFTKRSSRALDIRQSVSHQRGIRPERLLRCRRFRKISSQKIFKTSHGHLG